VHIKGQLIFVNGVTVLCPKMTC